MLNTTNSALQYQIENVDENKNEDVELTRHICVAEITRYEKFESLLVIRIVNIGSLPLDLSAAQCKKLCISCNCSLVFFTDVLLSMNCTFVHLQLLISE